MATEQKQITKEFPELSVRASVKPGSYDKEKRTFSVVFTTNTPVMRGFWEEYEEILSMDPDHVRMDRLNNGAPFLDDHRTWGGTENVLGVVVRNSAKLETNQGICDIQMSNRESLSEKRQDIEDGILPNVSVGYIVHRYQDISPVDDKGVIEKRVLLAVDWEPYEVSLVPIGADPNAQIRSKESKKHSVIIENFKQRSVSLDTTKTPPSDPVEPKVQQKSQETPDTVLSADDLEKAKLEAREAEKERQSQIRLACKGLKLENDFAQKLIDDDVSVHEARGIIIKKASEKTKTIKNHTQIESVGDPDTTEIRKLMEKALLVRSNPRKYKLEGKEQEFRYFKLIDVAKECLEATGQSTRGKSNQWIASRALHHTTDFPLILENISEISLRDGYDSIEQTFSPFVQWGTVSDLKQASSVQFGEAPKLKKMSEGEEYKSGTIDEGGEKYKAEKYGNSVIVTDIVIINDQLDAFSRVQSEFGKEAAELESDIFWGFITGNPTLSTTGKTLFSGSTGHGNLAASGGAIAIATIGKGREVMRKQPKLNKNTDRKVRIRPTHLVVGPENETVAEQFLAINVRQTADDNANGNPFRGTMDIVVEHRLGDDSATAWYLFASSAQIPMVKMVTLDGMRGPTIQVKEDFDTDGIKIKCKYFIGGTPLDYRGFYKNPGA